MTPSRQLPFLPSRSGLLRSHRGLPCALRCSAAPQLQAPPRRWASSKDDKGKGEQGRLPLHMLLLNSTYSRIQRERAEDARFGAMKSNRYEGDQGRESDIEIRRPLVILAAMALTCWISYRIGYYANREVSPNSTLPLYNTDPPKAEGAEHPLQVAWVDIRALLGEENVSTNLHDRQAHAGSDWSSYAEKESEIPFMVVRPRTTAEVSEIMRICHLRRIPVTPYSGGTSLEGHFAPTRGGICIDFMHMDQILTLHKEDLDVVVQPAVGWEHLNDYLAEHNLFFPPDPGPGAMIGGMVGTGCSGTNAYRYGTMRDWVLSLTVVLADGTVIKTRQRPRKSSAGYDLTRLFIGSEGTLGLVTEAVLKVTSKPMNTSVAVSSFPSIKHAADCVHRIVGAGVPIAAVEILDEVQMKCVNDAHSASAKKWREAPTLFFKFAGTPASVREHVSIVQGLARKAGSQSFDFAKNQEQADELWSARKEALWSVMAKRKEGDRVWTTDVAVPISRLPECIEKTKEDMVRSGLLGSIVGHVGDGNFHSIILFNESDREIAEDVVHRMVKRAIEMEGTATGEHGVGLIKRDYLPHELGETTVDLMRKMKQAFDPLCLLNCEKVVRVQLPQPGEVHEW